MGYLPDLRTIVLTVPGLIIAFSFHEYAHARMAVALGDDTPRLAGRLTLDPLAHLDPIGTLLLVIARFGWAKPVPINPMNFRDPRRGSLLVALAGPLTNLVLGMVLYILAAAIYRLSPNPGGSNLLDLVDMAAGLNVVLAVFNLIPVPPLDGSTVLSGLLPLRAAMAYAEVERYGAVVLILLVATGLTSLILSPAISVLSGLMVRVAFLIVGL